jgi:hypothetical protein
MQIIVQKKHTTEQPTKRSKTQKEFMKLNLPFKGKEKHNLEVD